MNSTMENEKKEYKERKSFDKQVFYFNDKGQLVVESNKGVWVDGEKFVKMYGDFVCNAKTMGEIIHQFKGIQVEVDTRPEEQKLNEFTEFLHKQYEECEKKYDELSAKKDTTINNFRVQVSELKEDITKRDEAIRKFNKLPWWKRFFKKIEVK